MGIKESTICLVVELTLACPTFIDYTNPPEACAMWFIMTAWVLSSILFSLFYLVYDLRFYIQNPTFWKEKMKHPVQNHFYPCGINRPREQYERALDHDYDLLPRSVNASTTSDADKIWNSYYSSVSARAILTYIRSDAKTDKQIFMEELIGARGVYIVLEPWKHIKTRKATRNIMICE